MAVRRLKRLPPPTRPPLKHKSPVRVRRCNQYSFGTAQRCLNARGIPQASRGQSMANMSSSCTLRWKWHVPGCSPCWTDSTVGPSITATSKN
eukprot:6173954-Pleurochrysis_carterae.AAC.1